MKKQTYQDMANQYHSRTLSVPSPIAINTTLLQAGLLEELMSADDFYRWEQMTRIRVELGLCFVIQLFNGCRINEVLKLKWSSEFMGIGFSSKGSKGSSARLLICPGYSSLLLSKSDINEDIFRGLTYSTIRRYYISFGCYYDQGPGERKIVTHLNRYNYIDRLRAGGNDIENIADIVGHKVSKNTSIYLKKISRLKK